MVNARGLTEFRWSAGPWGLSGRGRECGSSTDPVVTWRLTGSTRGGGFGMRGFAGIDIQDG